MSKQKATPSDSILPLGGVSFRSLWSNEGPMIVIVSCVGGAGSAATRTGASCDLADYRNHTPSSMIVLMSDFTSLRCFVRVCEGQWVLSRCFRQLHQELLGSMIQGMRCSRQVGIILLALLGSHLALFTQSELHISSLCFLEQSAREGSHMTVRVSGVYGPGLDHTVLEEPSCIAAGTWVELALQSDQNKEQLRKLLDRSHRAYVVVEGEFYGPPLPDPMLPEAIRKDYHPGWGRLGAFRTKLVVHAIKSVQPAPAAFRVPGVHR